MDKTEDNIVIDVHITRKYETDGEAEASFYVSAPMKKLAELLDDFIEKMELEKPLLVLIQFGTKNMFLMKYLLQKIYMSQLMQE